MTSLVQDRSTLLHYLQNGEASSIYIYIYILMLLWGFRDYTDGMQS